jgi:hypothetical protein
MTMNTHKKITICTLLGLVSPALVIAAGPNLSDIIILLISYLNVALVLMMGVAVVIFVYYVIKYFILPNENRSEAGSYVLYSVIGFFVILSFWGIVNVLQNTFGLQNDRNRPASWASFSNLFPGGGSNSGPRFNDSGINGTDSVDRFGIDDNNLPNNSSIDRYDGEAELRYPTPSSLPIQGNQSETRPDPEADLRTP